MKTLAYGPVPKTKKAIPAYLVVLAGKLTPRFEREGIRHKLERLDCNSGRDYAWAAGEAVAGVIRDQMEASFNIWLLIGEASFFYISICFPLAGAPLLQLAALMVLVLPLLRLRDAYAYPAEGSFREMLLDAAWTGACVIAFQEAARFMAPRLALPILNVYFAVAGAVMAAAWRMISRRQGPADPRHRELKERRIVVWHANVLFFVAGLTVLLSSQDAVPGSPNRDRLLGALPVWLMLASTVLRKAYYRSIWERPLLSIVDPDLKELSWDRATLWFRDKVSIFRADLITEVGYFGVLSYLVFVAAWRWVSDDPLSVMTDWLQVGVNLVAIMLLGLLWVRIKKMNEQLAKAIEEEIRLRELERRHG